MMHLPYPNLDRVYTIMGYQPGQIGLAGALMLGGMQLSNNLHWGWPGILASFIVAFLGLRFSSYLRDRYPGRALWCLQKNIQMPQHFIPDRDRQHVPLILEV